MESVNKCKQCGKERTRLNRLRHEKSHKRKAYVCRICRKILTRLEHLKRHLVTHLTEKPFPCKTCNRRFNRLDYLRNHIPRCKGEIVYTCDICSKVFDQEYNLEVHKKYHHDQEPKLPTIENLNNVKDHYYQIDQDANTTFSDHSDIDDCFEPKVDVTESADEEKVKEVAELTHDEESNVSEATLTGSGDDDNSESDDNDSNKKERASERLESEEMEVKEEKVVVNFKDECDIFGDNNEGDIVYSCDICNKTFNREDSFEVHKKIHDSQQSKLSRIDNLDNIEDPYCHIDQDADATFLHHPDVDGSIKPKVEVTESMDEEKKEVPELAHHYEENNVNENASIGGEEHNNIECKENIIDSLEIEETVVKEEVKKEEEGILVNFGDGYGILSENSEVTDEDSADSTVSEYLPKSNISTKVKRGRGRPRNNPNSPPKTPKVKVPGRGRGRPRRKIKKEEKDKEYDEYPCSACQEICTTMPQLDRHEKLKHEGLKVYKCEKCNKEFNQPSHLKRHVATHSVVKPYGCTICTKSFNRKYYLNRHMKLHERQKVYKCDICQKLFDASDLLAKHKFYQHIIEEKIMDEKKYDCPLCNKAFATEKYRDLHVNGHNGQRENMCDVCKKTFISKSNLTEHLKVHNKQSKKFLCSECGQTFTRRDFLVIHMRKHRGEKPFECKYCGKGFARTTDLTAHERCHTGEKNHLCTICGKGFGRPYHLTVHMRTHTGEKPHQCTYCDAAFAQGNDLKTHVRTHTGESLRCKLCTETFPKRYLLTKHNRAVHASNVVKLATNLPKGDSR